MYITLFDKNNLYRIFMMLFLIFFHQFGDNEKAIKGGNLNTKSLSKLLIPFTIWRNKKNCRKYNKNTKITKKFIKS